MDPPSDGANVSSGVTSNATNNHNGVAGKQGGFWNSARQIGRGIAGAVGRAAGAAIGSNLAAVPGLNIAAKWAADKALGYVNKMDKGVVKSGLKGVLKGLGGNAPGPVPGSHREDRPVQGTAGKAIKPDKSSPLSPPSNGTRNANAVVNSSIAGGYGDKEISSKNPRHAGPMMSNSYVVPEVRRNPFRASRSKAEKKRKKRH